MMMMHGSDPIRRGVLRDKAPRRSSVVQRFWNGRYAAETAALSLTCVCNRGTAEVRATSIRWARGGTAARATRGRWRSETIPSYWRGRLTTASAMLEFQTPNSCAVQQHSTARRSLRMRLVPRAKFKAGPRATCWSPNAGQSHSLPYSYTCTRTHTERQQYVFSFYIHHNVCLWMT